MIAADQIRTLAVDATTQLELEALTDRIVAENDVEQVAARTMIALARGEITPHDLEALA